MALNYLDKAAWDAGVYKDKGNDDDTQQDTSSEDSGYSASGILSAAKNFLEHPFQGMGTVIAPNYTPRPLDDSVYSDIPGTPVASGQFGELEDESVRDERMKDSADYMAANWPRLYGGFVAADEGLANVVGGIQNAVGGGNGILTNVQRAEEGMQDYRDQWNNTYGDSYFLNPNKFATDAGSVIGSSVPIMAFSGLMPGAAVAGGTRALTSALSRAGLGRLAMSKAGQALIADTVRSIPTSNLADSLSEYGTVVNDMMQNGVSEDEARRRAIPMFFKNMALDTFTVPLELGVMKGGKGIATGLLGRGAEEGIGKSLAKGAARTGMLAGASGLTEGYQEGAQNALENDVQGKRDGGWYNPFAWTNEDWEAARGGFVGGALMGIPGNVAAGFHPEAKQAPLSAESREQAQSIKDTLSHGKPKGMSNAAYNAYIELANSGNPDLIKQAASSLESFQKSQGNSSSESTDDAATEAYKDYEAYDQKQEIENFLNNNTVEQIGGEDNYNWLYGVLRNGTPEEVQKAYNDVIAAEKATAEQEAKNRPARSGGSVSPNTGNAMVNAVIQAANDSGVDPRLALAIAARESGGDDINAIHMPDPHDGIYGIMQAQDETVADLGLDSQYPDWQTDPYQNAMVGMAILKSKIANEDGDVWAGVRDYNGAGEEAEQYRQLVKNNYDNMGDIGSGNSWSDGITGYDLPTQGDNITAQVETLKPGWKQALPAIGGILNQMGLADGAAISSGGRTTAHNAEVDGAEHSYHINDDERGGGDAVDIVLPEGTTEEQAQAVLERFKATGAFKEVLFHDAGSGYHLHLGGYTGGLSSGGVSGKVTSDNGQFERELDQAAQEAKSDMDKIQAQSDQAMNEIMNDNSAEKTAQEAQEDAENAQKQAEESQQSTQDAVIPDVAQTIRDTSSNIDEINTLDGMFTKDGNGNDKFIDTPENRDYIKTNYKDEIDAAVKKAMQKTTAPKIKTQKKEDLPIVDGTSDVGPAARFMKSPHARLGNILADYDRNDPKFKGYMETFRHGTDEQQAQLADQLQQAQEQAKANSTTSNATVTTPSPANPSQQAVQAPKPAAQVNTPTPTQTAPKKAPKAQYEWGMRGYHWSGELNDKGKINIREADMSMYDSDMQFDVAKIQKAIAKAKTEEEVRGIIRNIAKNTYGAHVERLRMKIGGNASVEEWRTKHKESPEIQEVYDDLTKGLTNLYEQATGKTLKEQFAEKAPAKAVEAPKEKPTTNNTETPKETPQKEKVEEKKGEVKHEENKGNNVNTKPQQAESKDTESAHAEEGSQSDVQEEVSKFHDLLNSKKSTPRQVVDAYKRLADAVITDAKDNPSKATAGEKIITDNRDLAINDYKIRDVFIKRRLQREITAVYDDAHKELRAIIESTVKETAKKPTTETKKEAEVKEGVGNDGQEQGKSKGGNATKETKPEDTQETKSNDETQYSVRDAGETITRTKEAVKAEMKEAFKTASNVLEDGDRLTFTMPNGQKITVDVRNGIAVTDEELAQAKKDHDIDGNVVVEGYAQTHGKDAYIAVAQGSREGTGFHEAYHIAEKSVLTDKEKAAITKAIPDAEQRADKYAEWVEARKHGRGTAWGKLFQKIKDFAMKMKKIFTGVETVNDVFRQIESGEVWERKANSKDNQARYSIRQAQDSGQEEAPVKPQDIIDAINDIVHIYEGSRLTNKERKELRESSKFDPDQKQAVRPQATDLYDRHAHAGFNRMGYFNLSNYGRILALHLDNVMNLKGNLELTNKVLDRQDKNAAENKMNGVNERLTPSQARQNAVMDFGAMMIRNPELARETYPAYAKIFDEGLEKHPDLKEKLDRVIQLNETYQGQTAAERAAGSIAREREKVQLRKHPKEWLHTHFDKFYTNWVDDKHIFSKIVAKAEAELGRKLAYDYDVHKQAQMALNVASSRALLFLTGGKSTEDTYKVLNTVYGHAITKNVTMKDIMDALNKVSKEDVSKTGAENAYDALGNYLIAMRTEELEKHYHDAYARSAGFDEEGAREIIQNTPESIKQIAQMYWDINTNIVNILQQQGLISKDLAGKLRKYKHYCPMYRDMSDGIADMDEMIGTIGAFNKGGGYANVNNGIKRIEGGGKRPILDPITSLSQMAVSMISKCERNDVAKTFVKLGQDFSGLGDIVVRDPTLKHADPTAFAFTVWQNGEQVVYRTTPEIYDALTNNDAQANRFTIKIASGIAQTLRTGATISPSFIVRNLLRDTMSATVNSKTGFYLPFVDNVRGAWKLHFDKEFSAEYHASGASMSTYMRADADSSRDLTKELLGHKYDSYPVVVKQVRQLISYAWHKYEKFGNLVEDSTRAGEFRRARNQGLSIDQAGQLAREITLDFSRHGKKGQMVNKYVPFFNATIQGTDKFIRTFKDNPMRAIMNTVIWIILPSLGLWAINHDDDWYKELDENTKYTNWAIPLPGGTHLLIPKPQEVGILFGSGIEAVLNQMTGTDPHGMKEWARQYAEAMTPSLYPAVVRPLIEWMTNYSFWTGRNLVPASLQKAPSEMQFTSYTSELAKSLGDTWLAKNIQLSPIAIDNWISGWFGSAGRFVANMLNNPISYVRGNSRPSEPSKYWYEMPVIGSFIRQNGQNSEYINRMYEIQKDMNDDYERSDAGKQRKGKKSSSNKPKELKQVDTAVSSVSKLNKEIKAIRNDPKKDPDRKRREIDQRRTKINDLAKKVVLKFDK